MSRSSLPLSAALFLVLLGGCAAEPPPAAPTAATLPPPEAAPQPMEAVWPLPTDAGEERSIAGGESHRFTLDLEPGEWVRGSFEQHGADVVVRLLDPAGKEVAAADSPTGGWGTEWLEWIAARGGRHVWIVEAFPESGGRYRPRLDERRLAEAGDALRIGGASALRRAEALLEAGRTAEADALLAEALAAFEAAGDERGRGWVLERSATAARRAGRGEEALERFTAAAGFFEESGDPAHEARARNQACTIAFYLGRSREAIAACRQARALWQTLGDAEGAANVTYNLARIHQERAESQQAIELFRQALASYRTLDRPAGEARVLLDLGTLYLSLGHLDQALPMLRTSCVAWEQLDDPRGLALALDQLGRAHRVRGELDAAEPIHRRALALQTESGDRLGQVSSLTHLGIVHELRGEHEAALRLYRRALAVHRQVDRGGLHEQLQAELLLHLGSLLAQMARLEEAVEALTASRELFERLGRPLGIVYTTGELARAERDRGRIDAALAWLDESITTAETIRQDPHDLDLRASYFATVQGRFDLWIELLMTQGRTEEALAIRERARARSLLDVLGEKRLGSGQAAPTLSVPQIRRQVLDEETALVALHLGRDKSFAWLLTTTSLTGVELPRRAEVEPASDEVRRLLARSHRPEARVAAERALHRLSELLLRPLVPHFDRPRLAIVPEGALELLPWAALPDPRTGEPLLVRHELVTLPSASALAAQRTRKRSVARASREILVLTDPAFTGDRQALPSTAREGEAILRHVPPGQALILSGENASKTQLLAHHPERFRRLHLATHARVDRSTPWHARLVLAGGSEWTGEEIRRLHLPADLVVLSACHTGLGRETRGEGVLSLARSFLDAGAERVVLSLWAVEDRSTAELMGRFYAHHLGEGRPAPAALRAAQLELFQQGEAPSRWAPFLVQGDWR